MMTSSPAPGLRMEDGSREPPADRGNDGALIVLRLARVRNTGTVFRPAAPPEFWSAVHRAGLVLGLRWIVLPASTVGPPGHVEVYVFARASGGGRVAHDGQELVSLLALGFPQHTFVPVTAQDERIFAAAPFGDWAWSLALAQTEPVAAPARRLGFVRDDTPASPLPERFFPFDPALANPAQALFLLATGPVASAIDWTLVPTIVPDHLRGRPANAGPGQDADPLAFDCQVFWSGSAGAPPTVLGAAVAQAFGARDGTFGRVSRTPVAEALARELPVRDPNVAGLLVAHTALPGLLPSPDALAAVVPALRSAFRARVPESSLPDDGALMGRTLDGRTARLSVADSLRHVWIIGQTGTGKSTLLLNRILDDLEDGHGVAVFDPHGELVTDVLKRLPASRRDDVVTVDVSDRSQAQPVLNPLECCDVAGAHTRAGQVVELITSLWPRMMTGPMFEQASMHGLLLLAARFEQPGTVADLPRLFMDEEFRKDWLRSPDLEDRIPQTFQWWTKTYAKLSDFHRSESLEYYISKYNLFFTDPVLRALLGKSRSTLDLRHLMDHRGVLLCNLARSGVNPLATTMLTGVFMQSALNAALSRADLPAEKRTPFFVYCDEFQRIVGPSTGAILSEVRKYGLGLVLAHQFVDQLPEETLAAVLGNVGTKLIFRVGARDARRIVDYQPSLTVEELIRMPNFTVFAELLVGGVPSAPFTIHTPPPPPLRPTPPPPHSPRWRPARSGA